MQIPQALIIVGGLAMIATFVVNVVVGAIVRLREHRERPSLPVADLDARLARIEASVQSLALEVEQANEWARVQAGRGEVPRLYERRDAGSITPH